MKFGKFWGNGVTELVEIFVLFQYCWVTVRAVKYVWLRCYNFAEGTAKWFMVLVILRVIQRFKNMNG